MKTLQSLLLLSIASIHLCQAQDTTIVLHAKPFTKDKQIALTGLKGLLYKGTNDLDFAQKNQDHFGWKRMKPVEFSTNNAD